MNIQNIGGVHNNGEANLQIGLLDNAFIIGYNSSLGLITITDAESGKILPIAAPTASPYTFKGQYTTFTALTNAVTAKTITPANGDVYSIKTAGGTDANGTSITELSSIAYADGKWYLISK